MIEGIETNNGGRQRRPPYSNMRCHTMEATRPRLPCQTIKHILIDGATLARFPDRCADILKSFPDVKPEITDDFCDQTIAHRLKAAYPAAEITDQKKTASAVSAGKRFLVIGSAEREKGVEKFIDSKGMVCHGFFHIMVMNNGCVYNCQYCFLQQHIWDKDVSSHIRLNVNYEDIADRMRELARQRLDAGQATLFHTGILLDYLCFEPVTHFLEFLAPRLGDSDFARSNIDMWSKGNDINALLVAAAKYPWATRVILPGWSVNSIYAADRYEIGTARTRQRLAAARQLQDAGYKVTIRIDPMVPYRNWRTDYTDLVDMIFGEFGLRPDVVFVSSLRFDEPDLIETGRQRFPNSDLFSCDFLKEDRAKYRIPFVQRMELLRTVINRIRRHRPEQVVGVCKENVKTWRTLDLDPGKCCLAEPLLANTMDQFVLE